MHQSTFDKLQKFIVELTGVDEKQVTPDTKLYEDLGIYGDDANDLLISYGKRFRVDVSNFMAADYLLTVYDLVKGIGAGRLDEEVVKARINNIALYQVVMGNFQIEESPIPKSQILPMYYMHVLLDRDLRDHLPDKKYYEKYKELLTSIPKIPAKHFREQLDNSILQFYCKCGCHSFIVFPDPAVKIKAMPGFTVFSIEIAFETNYEEELNIHMFTNGYGMLEQVVVCLGQANEKPIPEDLQIGKLIGVWGIDKYANY